MSPFVRAIVAVMILVPTAAVAQDALMIGTWEWVSTSYTAGGVDTPLTVGHTRQIAFNQDHTFLAFRNEVPQLSTWWGVREVYVPPYFIQYTATGEGDTWWHIEFSYDSVLFMTLHDYVLLPSGGVGPHIKTELYSRRAAVASEDVSWGELKAGYR